MNVELIKSVQQLVELPEWEEHAIKKILPIVWYKTRPVQINERGTILSFDNEVPYIAISDKNASLGIRGFDKSKHYPRYSSHRVHTDWFVFWVMSRHPEIFKRQARKDMMKIFAHIAKAYDLVAANGYAIALQGHAPAVFGRVHMTEKYDAILIHSVLVEVWHTGRKHIRLDDAKLQTMSSSVQDAVYGVMHKILEQTERITDDIKNEVDSALDVITDLNLTEAIIA